MRCFCTGGGPLDGKTIETEITTELRCTDDQGHDWRYVAERWEWNDGRWGLAFHPYQNGASDRASVIAAFERDPTLFQPPISDPR